MWGVVGLGCGGRPSSWDAPFLPPNAAAAVAPAYGLTGSVYSSSEEKIERAKREFHVGNLYINRKCTGAVVGAHPFGGFKMSGTDSKAGGTDYLYLFSQAKSIGQKL